MKVFGSKEIKEGFGIVFVDKRLIGEEVCVIPKSEMGILFNCEKCGFEQTIDLDEYFEEYYKSD